jgi:SAM-dependent methyltransferase
LPFDDNTFDEIHAYEVLEHIGKQGDWMRILREWSEWWRILKPGGHLYASSPLWSSEWAWGDPGHTQGHLKCVPDVPRATNTPSKSARRR